VTFVTKGLKGFGFADGKILENVRINSLSLDMTRVEYSAITDLYLIQASKLNSNKPIQK
jgi:hypothetical protein